jgi:hypothetical protein
VLRFLALAFPAVALMISLFHFGWDALDLGADLNLAPRVLFASWLLEAVGLITLFLLIHGAGRGRFLAGIAAGWIAWVFRGPLLVLTLAGAARLAPEPWWNATLGWLGLYTLCGILLALLARRTGFDS